MPSSTENASICEKGLRLNDNEIMNLYRTAQHEAAVEADWRGIQGPSPSRGSSSPGGSSWPRRGALATAGAAPTPLPADSVASRGPDPTEEDQECLRILSRALQQPGRNPGAFMTSEILDTHPGSQEPLRHCCQPHVGSTMMPLGSPVEGTGNGTVQSANSSAWPDVRASLFRHA